MCDTSLLRFAHFIIHDIRCEVINILIFVKHTNAHIIKTTSTPNPLTVKSNGMLLIWHTGDRTDTTNDHVALFCVFFLSWFFMKIFHHLSIGWLSPLEWVDQYHRTHIFWFLTAYFINWIFAATELSLSLDLQGKINVKICVYSKIAENS